jgi:hypothetical protein
MQAESLPKTYRLFRERAVLCGCNASGCSGAAEEFSFTPLSFYSAIGGFFKLLRAGAAIHEKEQ